MKTLIPIVAAAALCGCALNRPYMRETSETTSTNGVVTKTERLSKATTIGLWPGTATVEKQRTSLGKTMSIGQQDIESNGGGTNMVESLRALDSIVGKLR